MKKIVNSAYVSGVLYEHDLKLKVTGENSKNPGTEYISGTISIATDDARTNIVPVNFTYVTATTKAGNPNATFNTLKQIIDGVLKSVMDGGETKLRVNGELGVNDFYSDRNGEVELVSAKRFDGRFVHVMTQPLEADETQRNVFEVDMLITGLKTQEATEDRPERHIIKGAVFNSYSKALLPVEFTIENPKAVAYFESLEPSTKTPVFTKVKVRMVSETVTSKKVEESAFGDPIVKETSFSRKDWVLFWAQSSGPYVWDSEESITAEEVTKAMGDREIYLASVKQRYEDYKASQGATSAPATANSAFNF